MAYRFRTLPFPLGRATWETTSASIDYLGGLAELGIDQALFNSPSVHELEFFELLAEIVPAVGKITPAGR